MSKGCVMETLGQPRYGKDFPVLITEQKLPCGSWQRLLSSQQPPTSLQRHLQNPSVMKQPSNPCYLAMPWGMIGGVHQLPEVSLHGHVGSL